VTQFFKSSEERDAFLEASYQYDRKGYRSTLAYVSGEQDALVRGFHESWDARGGRDGAHAALVLFEIEHFCAALEPLAHQMLWRAVKDSMQNGVPNQRRAKVPSRRREEGAEEYIRRVAVANGWMEPDAEPVRDMPAVEVAS